MTGRWLHATIVTGLAAVSMAGCLIGNRRFRKKLDRDMVHPLAPLVHGGPGRAGGGEEMGGMRGVKHFMQRTADPGDAGAFVRRHRSVAGRGIRARSDLHPFRKSLGRVEGWRPDRNGGSRSHAEKMSSISPSLPATRSTLTWTAQAAKANPFFDDRVAHGYLIASFAAGLFVDPAPGPVLANYGVDNLRFLTPVYFGDSLKVRLTCKEINPRENADHGEVRWDCQVTNQKG